MGLFSGRNNTVERYNAIRTSASILGISIPILFGSNRISGRLLWYGDFTVNKAKQQGGKGLSKGGTQYVYSASIIALLGHGVVPYLKNVWDSTGRFVLHTASENFTIPSGGGTYTAANASIYANDQGVAAQQSYSVGPFTDYGSPGPVTLSGTQLVPMTAVPSAPGAGQYSVNQSTGVYSFSAADVGKTVQIGYSYYRYEIITEEITVVPFSGPFTVTVDNSTNYLSDSGVQYYPSGTALTRVSGSPAVGQYSHSGATYTFNSGDSGQAIVISYVYKDVNTDTNAPTTLNLTLVSGTLAQAALSYMTSKHPGQAIGYSQLAYIFSSGLYLGYTPELPNYSYEIIANAIFGGGIIDCNPADCITQLLTDPGFGLGFPSAYLGSLTAARACWSANSFFISPFLENQSACASILGQWLEAGMTAAFWSEALLKFVPYSDTTAVGNGVTYSPSTTPIANITDDQFIVEKDEDPVKIERSAWQDAFNRVKIGYAARVNDYNPEVIYEQDDAAITRYGLRVADVTQYDFITTLLAAQFAASMKLQRVYIRNSYTFRLPDRFSWLEPMDVITINDANLGLASTPVRIQKIEDDYEKGLEITAEDFIWGTAQPAFNPKAVNSPYIPDLGQQDPGNTTAVIFEAPDRLGQLKGFVVYGFVNGANPNWGGCHAWVSFDGTNYTLLATITSPGRLGTLTASLPAFSGTNPDTADTLSVKLSVPGSTLASTSSSDASTFGTLCGIVNSSNQLELLSYQTAALAGAELYNVTTLYRGAYLTPAIAHSAGELFARLDQASFTKSYDPGYIGKTIFFKFTSFNLLGNQEQSLASVPATSFVLAGVGYGAWNGYVGAYGKNLLPNPGFESNLIGAPIQTAVPVGSPLCDNWLFAESDGNFFTAELDILASRVRSGSHSVAIQIFSGSLLAANTGYTGNVVNTTRLPMPAGNILRLSGYYTLDAGGSAGSGITVTVVLQVEVFDVNNNRLGVLAGQNSQTVTGAFTLLQGAVTIPATLGGGNPVWGRVSLALVVQNSNSTSATLANNFALHFDDISCVYQNTAFDVTPINTSAVPTASNLCTQSGSTTTINIAASTFQFGDGQVSYNSGSVNPSAYGTFYIYADDPTYSGGAVGYQWTTNSSVLTAANGRVFFGKITTVSGTGGGNSVGTGGTGGCFTPGTLIQTPEGPRPIGSLKVGDMVVTLSGPRRIAEVQVHEVKGVLLEMGDGELVTPEHLFVADTIKPASEIFLVHRRYEGKVYNLHIDTVIETERNFMLANGHCAHNFKLLNA